jgi:methanethiol S-methyltransferase
MIWLFLAVLLWGFLHSLMASMQLKALFLRWFGEPLKRFYRLAYNLLAGLSFLPVLAIAAVTPDRRLYLVELPWSALMVIGEILAVVMLVVGFRQTDMREFLGLRQLPSTSTAARKDGPIETKRGRLVTAGLYRYVRHPLYSAGLAFIWLIPLMTVNVLAINCALTVYVVIGAYFEERKLQLEFGREYSEYADVTPMFVPFLKWNKRPG